MSRLIGLSILPFFVVCLTGGAAFGAVDSTSSECAHSLKLSSTAGDSLNVNLIGRALYGPCGASWAEGDYAYAAGGAAVLILDVCDPAEPALVGRIYTPAMIWGFFLEGDLLYVAGGEAGLRIIEVSNPDQPVEVGPIGTVAFT